MRLSSAIAAFAVVLVGTTPHAGQEKPSTMPDVRLMTLDPGHFHAALVQKEMYPGVSPRVDVYAPLGFDLYEHLKRIDAYNRRADKPTAWATDVHASPDYFERMLREKPGNVVMMSGRNRGKIDRISASVQAGLHVLADKPWILKSSDFGKLESTLAEADKSGVVAYDIMTERFEITSMLQRALVNDRAVFGEQLPGTEADPAVYMESVHYLLKTGLRRAEHPAGRGSSTTRSRARGSMTSARTWSDLVQWTLFPDQALDYRKDVRVLSAQRWPTMIPEAEFRRVTGEPRFPASLGAVVKNGTLEYFCNTLVTYALRGVHVRLNAIWDWEPAPGSGDIHYAFYKGSRATIEVRQTQADKYRPELYVVPASAAVRGEVLNAVRARVAALQKEFPGVAV